MDSASCPWPSSPWSASWSARPCRAVAALPASSCARESVLPVHVELRIGGRSGDEARLAAASAAEEAVVAVSLVRRRKSSSSAWSESHAGPSSSTSSSSPPSSSAPRLPPSARGASRMYRCCCGFLSSWARRPYRGTISLTSVLASDFCDDLVVLSERWPPPVVVVVVIVVIADGELLESRNDSGMGGIWGGLDTRLAVVVLRLAAGDGEEAYRSVIFSSTVMLLVSLGWGREDDDDDDDDDGKTTPVAPALLGGGGSGGSCVGLPGVDDIRMDFLLSTEPPDWLRR
ncbi:hypothetical protein VTK73DRAFT_4552 [Phialemonium thermophilum]|uniref:Uncharacterized protein n=1 Tax=Phialemonium thermophilum TaxID=223376 RepID=A0ABR3V7N9_9PEZI